MRKQKAISWEKISEGILTADEISLLEKKNKSISLPLLNANVSNTISDIQIVPISGKTYKSDIRIVPVRGKMYNVINNLNTTPGVKVNKEPYRYLSYAVKLAVKEYKTAIRSGKWRLLSKVAA